MNPRVALIGTPDLQRCPFTKKTGDILRARTLPSTQLDTRLLLTRSFVAAACVAQTGDMQRHSRTCLGHAGASSGPQCPFDVIV